MRKLFIYIAVVAVGGCASKPPAVPTFAMQDNPVLIDIQDNSAQIGSLLTELVNLERSRTEGGAAYVPAEKALDANDPLQRRITFSWTGSARALVSRLATFAGVEFAVVGSAPQQPIVSIRASNQTVVSLLEQIDAQMGQVASVAYLPDQKRIELRFKEL